MGEIIALGLVGYIAVAWVVWRYVSRQADADLDRALKQDTEMAIAAFWPLSLLLWALLWLLVGLISLAKLVRRA